MKKIKLVLLLISLGSLCWAGGFDGGFGFGIFQLSNMDPAGMNTILSNHGYPEIERKANLDFGGGGYFVRDRLLIGFEGGSLSTGVTKGNGQEVQLDGGFLSVNAGYGLWKKDKNMIFVNAGLGFAGLTLSVKVQEGILDTYRQKSMNGLIGKIGLAYVRRMGGFIAGVEAGAIQPMSGLDIEGNRVGTTLLIRLLLGGGIF